MNKDAVKQFIFSYERFLGYVAVLALVVVGGYVILRLESQGEPEVLFASTVADDTLVRVDIRGAVKTPGVFELAYGSIVEDALLLAGGFAKDADQDWIDRELNRASVLQPGQKIYIPSVAETSSPDPDVTEDDCSRVNINNAPSSVLEDCLVGVGTVTAQAIIQGRPYQRVDDLITHEVLRESVFEKIKSQLVVR